MWWSGCYWDCEWHNTWKVPQLQHHSQWWNLYRKCSKPQVSSHPMYISNVLHVPAMSLHLPDFFHLPSLSSFSRLETLSTITEIRGPLRIQGWPEQTFPYLRNLRRVGHPNGTTLDLFCNDGQRCKFSPRPKLAIICAHWNLFIFFLCRWVQSSSSTQPSTTAVRPFFSGDYQWWRALPLQ